MILSCSGAPGFYGVDELVSELPFGFWYSFQDEIVSANEDKRATLMIKVVLVKCDDYDDGSHRNDKISSALHSSNGICAVEYSNWNQ